MLGMVILLNYGNDSLKWVLFFCILGNQARLSHSSMVRGLETDGSTIRILNGFEFKARVSRSSIFIISILQ